MWRRCLRRGPDVGGPIDAEAWNSTIVLAARQGTRFICSSSAVWATRATDGGAVPLGEGIRAMFARSNRDYLSALDSREACLALGDGLERSERFLERVGGRILLGKTLPQSFLFAREDFDELSVGARALLSAQLKILSQICRNRERREVLALFNAPARLEPFIHWQGLASTPTIARLDVIPTSTGYSFCELNVHPAVGGGEFETCARLLAPSLPSTTPESNSPSRDLGDLYAQLCRERDIARIVILDSKAHARLGYPRQELLLLSLAQSIAHVPVYFRDETDYPEEWLRPAEARRTLVHRMFTWEEMPEDARFFHQLWQSGTVIPNGFEAELRMNKRFLAWLWEPEFQRLLDDAELAAVRKYLPRTAILTSADLGRMLAEKDGYVFKVVSSYGGDGVLVGREHSAAALEREIRRVGLDAWIAQEFVESETLTLKAANGGANQYRFALGIYVFDGITNGVLVRASKSSVVNLTKADGLGGWAFVMDEAEQRRCIDDVLRINPS